MSADAIAKGREDVEKVRAAAAKLDEVARIVAELEQKEAAIFASLPPHLHEHLRTENEALDEFLANREVAAESAERSAQLRAEADKLEAKLDAAEKGGDDA